MHTPYRVYPKSAMDMVRHDDESVQSGVGEVAWDGIPADMGGLAAVVQTHFTIGNVAEERETLKGADGDEIRAR